jgi:hypothetical protein
MTGIMRVVAVAILSLFVFPMGVRTQLAQSGPPADRPEQGSVNRADPCALVPDPRGRAMGIEEHCALGGSGGVGRGDFNNDGIADLAVGVPDETRQSTNFDPDQFKLIVTDHPGAGAVNIIYGSATGLTSTGSQVLSQGPLRASTDAHFGRALAAGRFRGPGFASDLAVGAPGVRKNGSLTGAIYVFFSDATGKLSTTPNRTFLAEDFSTDGTSLGANPMDFPEDMTMVWGDFNGDGVGDLAAEVVNGGVQHANSRSAVLVLYGTAGVGLTASNYTLLVVDDALRPDPVFNPGCGVNRFCATSRGHIGLASGDLDGDSRDELLIGAAACREVDDNGNQLTGGPRGCVPIVDGEAPVLDPFGWDVLRSDVAGTARFGAALAVGDFDGDGDKDVAIGAPDASAGGALRAGTVTVFSAGFELPTMVLTQPGTNQVEANDRFGAALAANDFNGDGVTDLAVGAPGESTGTTTGHGAVNVFHGLAGVGLTPVLAVTPAAFLGPVGVLCCFGGAAFGSSLTAWNFGSTPQADLMIGSPFFTISRFLNNTIIATHPGAGAVLGMYGVLNVGLVFPVMQLWTQNPGFPVCTTGFCFATAGTARTGNHFGAAVY